MRKIKSIIALLLVTVLLLSGCGASNKSKYSSVVAATYGSERTVYLDEAGNEVYFNPGVTFIQILTSEKSVDILG